MAAGEGFEGVVDQVRVWVLADAGVDEGPPRIKVLAVATNDVLLDVCEVGLAASDAAGSRLAEEVLHALGDEKGNDKRESESSPAFLPLPELARNHGLS